jgi:hypothetical protein
MFKEQKYGYTFGCELVSKLINSKLTTGNIFSIKTTSFESIRTFCKTTFALQGSCSFGSFGSNVVARMSLGQSRKPKKDACG